VVSVEKRSNEQTSALISPFFCLLKALKGSPMKAKEKRVGTKAQIKAMKEKERRIATAIFLTIILLALIFSAYFAYTLLAQPSQDIIQPRLQFKPENPNPQLKAAIVDHLSLTFPNQTFMETAASILTKAGYTVDYFSGENVTVEFYRNLPTYGYRLIILRVHSTTGGFPFISFFTSERYTTSKYVNEQLEDRLNPVAYSHVEAQEGIGYFGITPLFVELSMEGRFTDTVILTMGCEGLRQTGMATAFIGKGAKVYIGWNESVSATHTDAATTQLLKHLATEKQTIEQAVENTMQEVGPDPAYKSLLTYYPLEVGEQTIENIKR
jgi:hypothetical protein